MLALLAFISIRMWHRQEVRLAALGAVLVAILSMGVTIHVAGKVSSMPVFVLGLIFPLLQRYLPGRLMLYLTFGGWLALSRLPILNNILPSRLMIFFYLLAGLLIAAWLSDMKTSPAGERRFGLLAVVAALLMLVPALPFPSTPNTVPRFFASSSVQRIPAGSVALVVESPVSNRRPYLVRSGRRRSICSTRWRTRQTLMSARRCECGAC